MIQIQKLYKSYGKKDVLKGINLTFERGVVNGIVGGNGAGKTTLFRCFTGLESYGGAISFEEGLSKNSMGFLPTTPYMLSKITGLEYLQLMCNARNVTIDNIEDQNPFELPLDSFADQYSTGMKKKLALTAIFFQKNEVFLFDEPFNGLDLQSNMLLKDIILRLRELNKIVIVSSHIFSALGEICDQIHHLKEGKIVDSANKPDFNRIEQNMRNEDFRKRIDRLNLA